MELYRAPSTIDDLKDLSFDQLKKCVFEIQACRQLISAGMYPGISMSELTIFIGMILTHLVNENDSDTVIADKLYYTENNRSIVILTKYGRISLRWSTSPGLDDVDFPPQLAIIFSGEFLRTERIYKYAEQERKRPEAYETMVNELANLMGGSKLK